MALEDLMRAGTGPVGHLPELRTHEARFFQDEPGFRGRIKTETTFLGIWQGKEWEILIEEIDSAIHFLAGKPLIQTSLPKMTFKEPGGASGAD
ncbi:Glycosyltransferase family 4 protein [Trichuris trichiura]|uniref:Glycosyltransferase family 4 protein n=1 Tax=Trichuris trichiura TaxID=36087 RepID=A0A077ZHU1_TRITR|nr:Glycosyltransferase family 4 protein [Trichuris trichiura]